MGFRVLGSERRYRHYGIKPQKDLSNHGFGGPLLHDSSRYGPSWLMSQASFLSLSDLGLRN